jgi:hypothetical protein
MLREAWIGVIGLAVATSAPRTVAAQVRASEAATVSQTVDGTTVTIAYSRPQARGRDSLFGRVVHFGDTWTPGANWATTIEVSKDVQVGGAALPEGKYSVWFVPRAGEWTVIFDPDERRFHTQRPRESADQIRSTVTPGEGPHVEVLTWSFPSVRRDGATLQMQWGTTVIALNVTVPPTRRRRSVVDGDAYRGSYRMNFVSERGESPEMAAEVQEREGRLYMRITPPFDESIDPDIALLPAGTHTFTPAFQKEGVILDVETEMKVVFHVQNGTATGFDMLGVRDAPMGKAKRAP